MVVENSRDLLRCLSHPTTRLSRPDKLRMKLFMFQFQWARDCECHAYTSSFQNTAAMTLLGVRSRFGPKFLLDVFREGSHVAQGLFLLVFAEFGSWHFSCSL